MHNHIFSFSQKERISVINNLEYAFSRQEHVPERLNESAYQHHLASLIGGKLEHYIKGVGRIDIMTNDLAIEVKNTTHFIRALGQALCYAYSMGGSYLPTVALFGKENRRVIEIASYYGFLVLYTQPGEVWYIANKDELLVPDNSQRAF